MAPKKVYRTRRAARRACEAHEYPKRTLPWSKKQGWICVEKTFWMKGARPREERGEEE